MFKESCVYQVKVMGPIPTVKLENVICCCDLVGENTHIIPNALRPSVLRRVFSHLSQQKEENGNNIKIDPPVSTSSLGQLISYLLKTEAAVC